MRWLSTNQERKQEQKVLCLTLIEAYLWSQQGRDCRDTSGCSLPTDKGKRRLSLLRWRLIGVSMVIALF